MQRPEGFRLNRNHPLGRTLASAPLAMLVRYAHDGMAWDSGAFGNHGTPTNFASPYTATSGPVWVPELGRWGWAFDGSDSIVVADKNEFTPAGDFSLACWFLVTAASGNNVLMNKAGISGTREWQITQDYTVGASGLGFLIGNNTGNWSTIHRSANVASGAWNHFAGVNSGTSVSSYLNGVLTKGPTTYTGTSVVNAAQAVEIGTAAGSFLNGRLCDAIYFNRALTLPEIQLLASRDPMLGGAIVGVGRRNFVGYTPAATGNRRRRLLLCS